MSGTPIKAAFLFGKSISEKDLGDACKVNWRKIPISLLDRIFEKHSQRGRNRLHC
jgi:hypothetical protein